MVSQFYYRSSNWEKKKNKNKNYCQIEQIMKSSFSQGKLNLCSDAKSPLIEVELNPPWTSWEQLEKKKYKEGIMFNIAYIYKNSSWQNIYILIYLSQVSLIRMIFNCVVFKWTFWFCYFISKILLSAKDRPLYE